MKRTVAIVLIIAGALLLAGSAMAFTLNERTERTRPSGTITKVVVDNENGDVTFSLGERTQVERTERWNFVRPDYSEDVTDGTLTIKTDCTSMLVFNNCGVELSVAVPSDVDVATKTTNGDVELTGLNGEEVSVATTNGDIDVVNVDVDNVSVSTSNGDLTFEDLSADTLRATTTNGDIDMALNSGPDTVTLASTNGDIDAALPNGAYEIRTATTNGDVSVDDALEDDEDAARRVTVTTTNGDIELNAS